jgi:acyl-CoA thioester hydrolase
MEHKIVSRRHALLAAEGKGIIVTYDYGLKQKAPIPADLRQRIVALEASAGHHLS